MRKEFGKYIVADSEICHGAFTFKGTRILVSVVLKQIAKGKNFDYIEKAWGGKVSQEALFEAISLAGQVSTRKT